MSRWLVWGILGLLIAQPSFAEGLGPVVAKEGSWEYHRQKDGFSDKSSCVITFLKKPYIQVNLGNLYFNYRGKGGVDGYEYRIDDAQSSGMKVSTGIDKSIGIINLTGSEFSSFMRSSRFRLQVLTLVSGIQNEDLSTKGLIKLYNRMVDECPE